MSRLRSCILTGGQCFSLGYRRCAGQHRTIGNGPRITTYRCLERWFHVVERMGRFGGSSLFGDDWVCFARLAKRNDRYILRLPLLLLELDAYSSLYEVFCSLICVLFLIMRVIHLLAPYFLFPGRRIVTVLEHPSVLGA